MAEKRLGIIMHGVTGRMGANQHLARSIAAIRDAGRRACSRTARASCPTRSSSAGAPDALQALAKAHGVERVTTDLDAALANKADTVFFDAASTQLRPTLLKQAIAAGKHVYCEKPTATDLAEAIDLYRAAKSGGREARRRAGQALAARPAQAQDADRLGLLRAASSRCAASSATGCSRATGSRRSGRRGTTARRTAAASSSTCCATGATCSTTCSARCRA